MPGECVAHFPGAELRSAIGMQDAASNFTAVPRHGRVQCIHRQLGGHP